MLLLSGSKYPEKMLRSFDNNSTGPNKKCEMQIHGHRALRGSCHGCRVCMVVHGVWRRSTDHMDWPSTVSELRWRGQHVFVFYLSIRAAFYHLNVRSRRCWNVQRTQRTVRELVTAESPPLAQPVAHWLDRHLHGPTLPHLVRFPPTLWFFFKQWFGFQSWKQWFGILRSCWCYFWIPEAT